MRRKLLLVGLVLIFIVSAAFSSVYLHPKITIYPINTPDKSSPTVISAPEPEPEPEPEHVVEPEAEPAPYESSSSPSATRLTAITPTPAEIVALGDVPAVPHTNFGFTIPGNIVNLASLHLDLASQPASEADMVATWHYIVSATTAALVLGGVAVYFARFLSQNMLE